MPDMKFLSGLFKRSGNGGKQSAPAHKLGAKGGLSIGRIVLFAFLTGAATLLLMALFLFVSFRSDVSELQGGQAQVAADSLSAYMEGLFEQHTATMELRAKDPLVAQVLADGDKDLIRAMETQLAYLFPEAVRVRLLKPGMADVDTSTTPNLSYACLDLLRESELKEAPPLAEVHMFNTPQQHIDLVRRVLGPTGRHIVGNLMVSFPVQVLQQALDKVKVTDGYAEVRQVTDDGKYLVLAAQGVAGFQDLPPQREVAVPGTRWRLAYWAGDAGTAAADGAVWRYIAVVALAIVLLGAAMLVLLRTLAAALRTDMVALINLMKDLGEGRARNAYPARLADVRGTLELMTRMAREMSASRKVSATPDRGTAPASSAPAPAKGGGLEVQEAPASGAPAANPPSIKVDDSIFRAYDIRGVVGATLTADVVYQLGRAIGSAAAEAYQQSVIIARDGRLSGPEFSNALSKGLRASGVSVIDIGCVPTPLLYFATHYLNSNSGVMLTGSHNPPDYNGLKIVVGGDTLSGDAIQSLRKRIATGDLASGTGTLETVDVSDDYIDRVTSDVRLARPMKVVVDCGNGVAGEIAPQLLEALGCEVIRLYCDIDGTFPNHHPDPSRPENVRDLIHAVQENGADIGLAFDGDGDRLGVISSGGRIIWPDRVLMLLAMDVLTRNPGADIIYDVKCSRYLERIISEHGGRPLMWKTGHSLIKAKMKETGALLAGEMSGHIFFKERWFGFDDALYTAARLLEVLAADPRSSHKVFESLPDSINTPEINVRMAEGEHHKFMRKLLSAAQFDDARISTIDGLRADFDKGWGLVRASNTTPCLVLRFEADDEISLSTIQARFKKLMLDIDPGLKIDF
jgi:phosphomannomutase/phosphoglucomutase